MELAFNKSNLVYLLLVVHRERPNGIFFENLRAALEEAWRDAADNRMAPPPSRATWFNYFRDFDACWPDGFPCEEAASRALDFVREHPKKTDKYYRRFNRVTFGRMRDFLADNGYIGGSSLRQMIAGVPGGLYYALVDFLDPKGFPERDHESLSGTFRVYRPSISSPGKILVSAARISSKPGGPLRYEERMHFRTSFGWRQQNFEGYAIGVEGKTFLLTKDDNTRLLQFSILRSLVSQDYPHRAPRIRVLAGSYTGCSHARKNEMFTTGIVMVRDDLRALERYPVRKWKVGHLGPFGLQSRDDVPDQFLPYLHDDAS